MEYAEFLEKKKISDKPTGLKVVPELNPMLFYFQRDIVKWALKRGRAAIWADCGLGKGPMALEWAKHVPGRVLIVAPLAVSHQFKREAEKFGVDVCVAKTPDQAEGRIIITNYERVDLFDASEFTGVVLDESSILKAHDGKTRSMMIEKFQQTPFRLCCTATPAPNDHMELGNHAEFLGTMSRVEMLSMFFVHDGGDTAKWRLKGHAKSEFWKWLASWAVMIRKPSDLGYSDDGFDLPDLHMHQHTVEVDKPTEGMLFAMEAQTLQDRLRARRDTIADRVAELRSVVFSSITPSFTINSQEKTREGYADVEEGVRREQEETGRRGPFAEGEEDGGRPCKGGEEQGTTEGIHAGIREEKPSEIQENQRAAAGIQQEAQGRIRGESYSEGKSKGESKGMATEQSSEKEKSEDENIRDDGDGFHGDACDAEREMRHLRTLGYGRPKLLPGSGSLPRDGGRKGSTLHELQHGHREVRRQRGSTDIGSNVSEITPWIIWCNLNDEQLEIEKIFGDIAISITGSLPPDEKEKRLLDWLAGVRPILISKTSIIGFGINAQNCHNMAFVGLSDSYEQFYQAVRRCWRFGQKKPVHVHMITAQTEGAVVANIKRKEKDAMEMAAIMVEHMKEINTASINGATVREKSPYVRYMEKGAGWTAHLGDCVDVASEMKDDSLHYTVYSPPFASLYTYSNSDRDMGNCTDYDVFFEQYKFLVKEIYRATMPGRLVSFHCMNLPTSKERHGFIGIQDFRGDLIRIHQDAGFIFHSEVCIWKDPVTAMQRTKALGLLHKQIRKDSCMSRQGIPDYLVTMRKPGENPEKVSHTHDDFPVSLWQRYASPVWMDINPSDTLQYRSAREHNDERHICPLQLEVIRRALKLWSNPGDLVFSPFMGIGSEGYVAIQEGRKFVGSELKRSYYEQSCRNLAAAEKEQFTLFSE